MDLVAQTSARMQEEPLLVDPTQQPNGVRSAPNHDSFGKSPKTSNGSMDDWDHDD